MQQKCKKKTINNYFRIHTCYNSFNGNRKQSNTYQLPKIEKKINDRKFIIIITILSTLVFRS